MDYLYCVMSSLRVSMGCFLGYGLLRRKRLNSTYLLRLGAVYTNRGRGGVLWAHLFSPVYVAMLEYSCTRNIYYSFSL